MSDTNLIYYRLIALWAICEAMIGGIIHGLKIPVSGLVVGSCAIICICLIAWYVPKKGMIMKATLIVAIFKMMLSPQASIMAYVAVFFQGTMGEILFWNRKYYRLSCMLLAIVGLLESGMQRIVVLMILYGDNFWTAINESISKLIKQKAVINYSWWIGVGYVALHGIAGLFVGWWAAILPNRINKWRDDPKWLIGNLSVVPNSKPSKKRKRLRKLLFAIWILLIGLYVQSYFKIGTPLLPSNIVLKILIRSLIIVLSWVFIVGPILKQVLHNWLTKKQTRSQQDVKAVLELLPATQRLLQESWRKAGTVKGLKRIKFFGTLVLVNALRENENQKIYILSGLINSGKTTALINWASGRKDVRGIFTPIVDGKRVFMNAETKEQFPMEAESDEEALLVGKYRFSKINFERAKNIIRESINDSGWLVIDEVGPLELRGEGFANVLKEVVNDRKEKLIIVVRERIEQKVQVYFNIEGAKVIGRDFLAADYYDD